MSGFDIINCKKTVAGGEATGEVAAVEESGFARASGAGWCHGELSARRRGFS